MNEIPRRTRKRKFPRDESVQASAFPQSPSSPADEIRSDAAQKDEVKKAAAAIPEIFTPQQVEWVFDVYVGILSFVYSLALKSDFKAINEELEFTDDQKKALAEPLAKVLSKYAPSEWAGATAEIQLITTLGIWTVSSFQRARNVQKKLEEEKKAENRTRPVAPMHRPQSEIHVPA